MNLWIFPVATLCLLYIASCSDAAPPKGVAPECTRNGVCDDGVFCNGEERCKDGKCVAGDAVDCDDHIACSADRCDETLWACQHDAPDADSDGHSDASCKDARGRPFGDDCDDSDAARHPGATEMCDLNEVDEDCDPSTVGDQDEDGDGAISLACCNTTAHERQCGPDCEDINPSIGPNASEVCDGIDNDCDGQIDEGVKLVLFRDQDLDGYGAGISMLQTCTKVRGYATLDGDCDDHDPTLHPGAAESCDLPALDRDCNGRPNDLAGGCTCVTGSERPCPLPGLCGAGTVACVNESWSSSCSIAPLPEVCNGLDDDCDGHVDDDLLIDCYEDEDEDGYAAAGAQAESVCPTSAQADGCPDGFTRRAPSVGAIDCAPKARVVSPAAPELCNGKDDDCNGAIDDELTVVQRYIDSDGDGHPGTTVQRCATDPTSYDSADDCMDDNPLVYPGQAGVFSSPACGSGFVPCASSESTWRCKLASSDACGSELRAARWDYDCDGSAVGEPLVSDPCLTVSNCGGGCGPSGFQASSSGIPSCGSTQAYQVCRCLGAQGGGCTGAIEQHSYPCH